MKVSARDLRPGALFLLCSTLAGVIMSGIDRTGFGPDEGTSGAGKRDSIKNGLLIGAAVGAVLSVLTTKVADCPSGSEGGCPGTKALGVALTIATTAGIGAGIDALLTVQVAAPTAGNRGVFVGRTVTW